MFELDPSKTRRCHVRTSQHWPLLFPTRSPSLHVSFSTVKVKRSLEAVNTGVHAVQPLVISFIRLHLEWGTTAPASSSLLSRNRQLEITQQELTSAHQRRRPLRSMDAREGCHSEPIVIPPPLIRVPAKEIATPLRSRTSL
jgi:hypothetical protein